MVTWSIQEIPIMAIGRHWMATTEAAGWQLFTWFQRRTSQNEVPMLFVNPTISQHGYTCCQFLWNHSLHACLHSHHSWAYQKDVSPCLTQSKEDVAATEESAAHEEGRKNVRVRRRAPHTEPMMVLRGSGITLTLSLQNASQQLHQRIMVLVSELWKKWKFGTKKMGHIATLNNTLKLTIRPFSNISFIIYFTMKMNASIVDNFLSAKSQRWYSCQYKAFMYIFY